MKTGNAKVYCPIDFAIFSRETHADVQLYSGRDI